MKIAVGRATIDDFRHMTWKEVGGWADTATFDGKARQPPQV
jgi:hypothetical protein